MDWRVWDFHLQGNLEDNLTALVEELTALMERLRTGESQIGRGMPRGQYARLGIHPPIVTWEHDKERGDVVPFVRVTGYDLLTLPGEPERQADLGELAVFSLADWGHGIGGRVGFSRVVFEAADIVGSVFYRLDGRWQIDDLMHSTGSIFRAFEHALRNALRNALLAEQKATEPEPPGAPPPPGEQGQEVEELTDPEKLLLQLWCDRYTAIEIANWPRIPWRSAGTVLNKITELRNRLGKQIVPYHRG